MQPKTWIALTLFVLIAGGAAIYGLKPSGAGSVRDAQQQTASGANNLQSLGQGGSPPAPSRTEAAPQSVQAVRNGVEVVVTLLNATEPQPDGQLAFAITLDNHAIDLSNLKLDGKAVLTPDPGEPTSRGFGWKQEGSGHHASGLLTFRNQDAAGKPLVTRQTRSLTLELRDAVGSGNLVFRFENDGWNVPEQP